MNQPVPRSTLGVREQRVQRRSPVALGGILQYQDESYDCIIRDVNTRGFFISCRHRFSPGQFLQLRCHLHLTQRLDCMVEVTHVSVAGIGTKIVSIDEENRRLYRHFVQHLDPQ